MRPSSLVRWIKEQEFSLHFLTTSPMSGVHGLIVINKSSISNILYPSLLVINTYFISIISNIFHSKGIKEI